MPTIKCKQCGDKFTHPTKNQCDSALRMHVGREHTGNIRSHGQKTVKVAANGGRYPVGSVIVAEAAGSNETGPGLGLDRGRWQSKVIGRPSRLNPVESGAVLSFIRERRGEFDTKSACFLAAVEAAGVTGKIKTNSVAVDRYFKKALKGQRRKYTRRTQAKEPVSDVLCFCPKCGLNVAVARTAMTVALRHSPALH